MSDLKQLLQVPPYATDAEITRTVNQVIKQLIPGYSSPAKNTDWNNLQTPGLYLNSASASNSPALTATDYYCLTIAYANSSDRAQVAIPYDVADTLWIRNFYSSTWNAWTQCGGGGSGMTNPMTTEGDIIYEDATPAPNRLAIGTTGQVLTVVSGLPGWATPSSGGGADEVLLLLSLGMR